MPFISFDHPLHTVSFFSDTLVGRFTIDFYDVPDSEVTIFANGCFIGVSGVYHSYHFCRTSFGPPGPD